MAATIAQMPEAPTAANNGVSLQISLPQMLDLALGAPEVGAVNFNILHNFLHILLHQINLQTTSVEFHGENADRIKGMVTSLKPSPILQLHEYNVIDATGVISHRFRRDDGVDADVLTEDIQLPAEEILTKEMRQQIDLEKVPEAPMVVSVVNGAPPTILAFKELEQTVKQLQQQYQALEDLSTAPQVVERLKDTDSAAEAFININKRLDTNEQGIDKLTGMIQDVKGDVTTDTSVINARLNELEDKVSKMEQWLINLQTVIDILTTDLNVPTTDTDVAVEEKEEIQPAKIAEVETVPTNDMLVPRNKKEGNEENANEIFKTAANQMRRITPEILAPRVALLNDSAMTEIRQDVNTLKMNVGHIQQELQDLNTRDLNTRVMHDSAITDIRQDITTLKMDVAHIQQEVQDLNTRVMFAEPIKDTEKIVDASAANACLEQCMDSIKNIDTTYGEALNNVTQRMVSLETEIEHLFKKVDIIQEVSKTDDINIKKFITKVQGIETDIEKVEQAMDRLLDDKEKQDTNVNTLLEQIELLKIIKANKEDLEDALADKADTQTMNRKVSHTQFDAACDDLARGLEEAIDKLTKQESIWQQALDEVQNEIATKMDKIEMLPLKDFVNNKLKSLQDKLKIMVEARQEIEAAGTKKLLRDVQCISCDKDVIMKTEEVDRFRTEPLPCTTSIKPYLTYELDKVRKQLRKLPYSRNMIQYEAMMQDEIKKAKAKEEMIAKTPRDHLINRYCGGSHTITTPQQRVMRTGHFLLEWGPETIQLTDGLIRGKDGQMYRSRLMSGKDVCGPDCWESQISEETGPLESASTVLRKSLPSRRHSAGNQKRNSGKRSKESRVSELEEKSTMHQVTSRQENDDRPSFVPVGLQDLRDYLI